MCLNCLKETLALVKDCMRLHSGIADLPRKGGSTKLLVGPGVVTLEWDEHLLSALHSSGWSFKNL